jgi:DHA1 family bicyclomycin/chloramphenicol resistance-like MFS transporter
MLRPGTFALTALLAALSATGPLTTDMYLPSLPDIARQLNASTAQVQFTISAYLIGFAVGQIFYGPVSDRHGRKPVLMAAIALYCVASLACALSTSIEMLIVSRAFQALGGCGGIVLTRAIVRDIYSGSHAGRELSMIAAVMALAPVLAPIAGGVLQTGFGWRSVFFTLVAVGIAGVAVVWAALPETLNMRAAEPVSISSMLRSYRIVARNPAYLAYLGITSASYAGLFAWISGSAFVLQDLYGLPPFDFGVAFALGSIGYMTGSALAARMVVRLGLDGVLGLGGCACAAGGLGMLAALRSACRRFCHSFYRWASISPGLAWCCRRGLPAR